MSKPYKNRKWCRDDKYKIFITVYTEEDGKRSFTSYYDYENFSNAYEYTIHRLDGPAKEFRNGGKQWYISNECLSKESHNKLIQEVKDMPLVLRLVDPRRWVREFK